MDLTLVFVVGVSSGLVFVLSRRRGDPGTAVASALGAALVLLGRLAFDQPALTGAGAVLLVGSALVNGVRCRRAAAPAPTTA
jgi:hypothetical protein